MAMWDSAIGSPNRGAAAARRYPAGAVDVRVGALTARARVQVLAFRHPALALIEAATDLPGRMLLSRGAIRNRLDLCRPGRRVRTPLGGLGFGDIGPPRGRPAGKKCSGQWRGPSP